MKQKNNRMITGALYLLLIFFAAQAVYAGYNYYTGPNRAVERYAKALENGNYEKAYKLLNEESIDKGVTSKQMINYYKGVYANKLLQVQKVGSIVVKGSNTASCKVVYTFKNQSKEDKLQLVKNSNRWEIVSPFKTSDVTIYAPALAKVYINGKSVSNQNEGMFIKEGLLPGNYMLQVTFPETDYKDYHQVIKIPEQTEVVLPYDMVNVGVKTIKGMEVSLGQLQKVAGKAKVNFSDILPGEYTLTIKSPYDVLEPLKTEITVGNTNCSLNYEDVKLSENGKKKWKMFVNDFYNDYLADIKEQEANRIRDYFTEGNKAAQLELFNEWFIQDKDIQNTKLKVETQADQVTRDGYLQGEMMEIVELTNREEVEGGMENRVYRLVLKWDTQIDVMKERWQIVNRTLKESIVAYQSEDGRWIQY